MTCCMTVQLAIERKVLKLISFDSLEEFEIDLFGNALEWLCTSFWSRKCTRK